ncbi:MAG TPA: aspartyl protease family protein [Tepidisphaeraceae bacterium]|jgi:hypothetical protein
MRKRAIGVLGLAIWAQPLFAIQPLSTGLISVDSIQPISLLPLNSPPINGFTPQVVYGLTDKQDSSYDYEGSSVPSGLPDGGNTLPIGSSPYYSTAIFDIGSQSDLFTYEDAQIFNFESANREGAYTQEIEGASGSEETDISDALGVYATGFQNATVTNNVISAPQSAFSGQWNTAVLTTQSAPSDLPNVVGSPMASQYQTVISNSHTVRMTVNGQTLRTPEVSFQANDTPLSSSYVRLSLSVQSPLGNTPDPVYIPSLDNYDNLADDPSTPSFWGSFFANVNVSGSGGSVSNASFLLDTGAEVSVLSEDTAASVGFYSAGPNKSTPAFYVSVSGVGGTTQNVPGFYLPTLSFITNGGPITYTNVPVVVLDIPNPATGSGYVPGILGTNLFTDRDLILNGDVNSPWLGISPILTPQWNIDANGTWGTDANWIMGVPDADVQDAPANFLSAITAHRQITVDGNYTVGSITFNNTNSYTLLGPGTLTLSNSSGTATIEVVTGSHTIAAPLIFSNNTNITIDSASSTLSLTNDISPGNTITSKLGPGTLIIGGSVPFGGLAIQQGLLRFLPKATISVGSGALYIAAGATLDVTNDTVKVNDQGNLPASTLINYLKTGYDQGKWDGAGIDSSSAATTPGTTLGYSDASGTFTIQYTWYGDANLDGVVNDLDLTAMSSTGTTWATGDFNYDGKVNSDDYALFMLGNSTSAGKNISTILPEPSFLLGSSFWLLATPRRRRK